MKIIKIYLSRL